MPSGVASETRLPSRDKSASIHTSALGSVCACAVRGTIWLPLRVDGARSFLDAVARRETELLARTPVVDQADVTQVVQLFLREVGRAIVPQAGDHGVDQRPRHRPRLLVPQPQQLG